MTAQKRIASLLEIYDIKQNTRTVVRRLERLIEAPNWLADGDTLIYNAVGKLWRYSLSQDKEELVETGDCTSCNNDHVPSPDQRLMAVSNNDEIDGQSRIYLLPLAGGQPQRVTDKGFSYLHGFAPDGETLAYCALFRGGNTDGDICTIHLHERQEKRLTTNAGHNDGPEFSVDGRYIWFNSTRSGSMQIWRMGADGSNPVHMHKSRRYDWFPHVSPDGQKVVFLSYNPKDLLPNQHLPNLNVEIWMIDTNGKNPCRLVELFGGQGTINVNSWAPDSSKFAFVSYERI